MKVKNDRLEALRMIISSQELGSQEELLTALKQEGFTLTQATLSRDLKQLKVAKAASMRGNYVYVLPNDTMYKRYNIDNSNIDDILGTIAGDDTILIVIKQGVHTQQVIDALSEVVPNMK